MLRRITIATSTRADWGLLSPLAKRLKALPTVDLSILATNMHLNSKFGNSIDEIKADGFNIDAMAYMSTEPATNVETAKSMGECMISASEAFSNLKPDILVILGDRYEMLAVAATALVMKIPIVHIAGGEISEGAFDDSIRHAITKLAYLHLTATEEYRHRVIQMGENPARVVNTGAIGVYNCMNTPLMTRQELEKSIGWEFSDKCLLVTLHPTTLDNQSPRQTAKAMFNAIERFADYRVLVTYPNNDPGADQIIEEIHTFASSHPETVKVVPSLGRKRYLSVLQFVSAVIGNSSSGIVEVPSMKIPTVDIGIRQRGRLAAKSIIHCETTEESICKAISSALDFDTSSITNPYYQPNTLDLMINAIMAMDTANISIKSFYDIPEHL